MQIVLAADPPDSNSFEFALGAQAMFADLSLDNQMFVIATFNMTISPIPSDSSLRRPRWSWHGALLHHTLLDLVLKTISRLYKFIFYLL